MNILESMRNFFNYLYLSVGWNTVAACSSHADYGLLAAQTNTGQRLQLQRVVEYDKNRNITVKITENK